MQDARLDPHCSHKSFIVNKENYLLELGRYIHLNPVRAGIAEKADDYRWSSYKEYINKNAKQKVTDTENTLYLFSRIRAEAIKLYRKFVYAGMEKDSPLDEAVGSVLGDEGFTEKVLKYLKGYPDKREIPDIKKIEAKYNLEDVVKSVARYYGVSKEGLLRRNRTLGRQRKMAIYLCKIVSGKKNIDIGKIFGISTQAVSNVVRDSECTKDRNKKMALEIHTIKEAIKG